MNKYLTKILFLIFTPLTKPVIIAKEIAHRRNKKFPEVDFLKAISVFMIIIFHTFFAVFFIFQTNPVKLEGFINSIPSVLHIVFSTDKAVDIFFMISSFLLSYSMLKTYAKQQKINIARFYFHRFFRIYPLFLVALFLYGLADLDKLINYGWHSLLFIDNILHTSIIPVGWSLSIEMQFYAVLPFLVWFLATKTRPLLWLWLLVLISIIARFYFAYSNEIIYQSPWLAFFDKLDPKTYMDQMYYSIETRITPLLLGVVWAFIVFRHEGTKIIFNYYIRLFLITMSLITIYLAMHFPIYNAQSWFYADFNFHLNLLFISLHRAIFAIALLALVLLLSFSRSSYKQVDFRIYNWRIWKIFSELAFPIYFFHFPLVAVSWVLILGTTDVKTITKIELWQIPLVFCLAVLLSLYISIWLYHWVEKPGIKLGKILEKKYFTKS